MTTTKQVIADMLKENTGTHFLDSGGVYGRHWQENQVRNFDQEPEALLTFEYGDIDMTINVYHWLCDVVIYDPDMTKLFYEYAELPENEDIPYWPLCGDFPRWLQEEKGYEVTGLYGEPTTEPIGQNTYNHDSLISQVIQFAYFEIDLEGYVLLQIHGGCDVRGGYTAPKVFNVSIDDRPSIFDDADGTIRCPVCNAFWYTDDAYHWYSEYYSVELPEEQVEHLFDPGKIDLSKYPSKLNDFELIELDNGQKPVSSPDKLFYDDDGNGYCPICSKGILQANIY